MQHSVAALAVLLAGCAFWGKEAETAVDAPAFSATAPWADKAAIPAKYTCDGQDVSPAISLADLPENTTHLALLMDDPDAPAGTWVHWLWWDEPVRASIEEGTEPGISGKNSWDRTGYGGPCPPSGTHRYFIHVYALDGRLGLPEGSDRAAFAQALEGHAIGHAVIEGTYER